MPNRPVAPNDGNKHSLPNHPRPKPAPKPGTDPKRPPAKPKGT